MFARKGWATGVTKRKLTRGRESRDLNQCLLGPVGGVGGGRQEGVPGPRGARVRNAWTRPHSSRGWGVYERGSPTWAILALVISPLLTHPFLLEPSEAEFGVLNWVPTSL